MASQKRSTLAWNIAGCSFAMAGLLWTVSGNVPIGMMNVVIGMMFITLGLASKRTPNDRENPSGGGPPKT